MNALSRFSSSDKILTFLVLSSKIRFFILSFISSAAAFVKVTIKKSFNLCLFKSLFTIRSTKTEVLPEPALAETTIKSPSTFMALICSGVNFFLFIFMFKFLTHNINYFFYFFISFSFDKINVKIFAYIFILASFAVKIIV